MHLGNKTMENLCLRRFLIKETQIPNFSYAPNLLSKLKVRAKEKNKYIYLAFLSVFTTFDLRSKFFAFCSRKLLTFEKTQIIFGFLLT